MSVTYASTTFTSTTMTLVDSAVSRTILEGSASGTYVVRLSANPIDDVSLLIKIERERSVSVRLEVNNVAIGNYITFTSSTWIPV